MREDIWPLLILFDRYGGVYSGGKWLAFNLDPADWKGSLNDDPMGGDDEAMWFAKTAQPVPWGKGDTPDAAVEDLAQQLKARSTR